MNYVNRKDVDEQARAELCQGQIQGGLHNEAELK